MELNTEDQTISHAQEHHQQNVPDYRKTKGNGGIKNKIWTLLEAISFGKFTAGLYLRGRLQYSSVTGGLITILVLVVFLAYSSIIISKTLQGNDFMVSNTIEDLYYSELTQDIKLGDF